MEIHQLRYALEVHRRGSFTAAAGALHISQSGVSAQVAKLERELGVTLFDRSARTTTPTAEGTVLLPLMTTALADIDRVARARDELLGLVRGTVRVGTIIGCTVPGYLDGFAEFRAKYPGITVTAGEAGSDELLAGLMSGSLDAVLLAHHEQLPDHLDVNTIVDEPIAVGVAAEHPWADRPAVTVEELADSAVITLAPGTGIRAALRRSCADAGVEVLPAVEAHSPDTVLALAARGAGVAVLSKSMIGPPLTRVPVRRAARAKLSFVVCPHPGPAVRAFAEVLGRYLDPTR